MAAGRDAKAVLKHCVKRIARIPGMFYRAPGVRILTYHSIGYRAHDMNVTPESFRAQMEWLADRGGAIPLDAAVEAERGIALTFDDGYLDNLIHAAPVLHALGLPATVFVVAGRVGETLHAEDDPETGRLMTWDEIAALASQGIAIGAHTLTHRRLSSLSEAEQRAEIVESKRRIESRLGRPVSALAYPFGSLLDYNDRSISLVLEAGYMVAVSNRYGVNTAQRDRWALRRIWIDATDDLGMFQAKVEGGLDALAWLDSPWGIRGRRWLNRLLRVQQG